jgi:hypothetical protein
VLKHALYVYTCVRGKPFGGIFGAAGKLNVGAASSRDSLISFPLPRGERFRASKESVAITTKAMMLLYVFGTMLNPK